MEYVLQPRMIKYLKMSWIKVLDTQRLNCDHWIFPRLHITYHFSNNVLHIDWTTKAESLTTEQVVKFLISIKLESCVKAVEAAEVDGCLMAAAVRSEKDDMLKDIGITRAHHMFKVRSNFSKFVQNV